MTSLPVIIIGANPFAIEVAHILQINNVVIYGFLDDDPKKQGTEIGEISVLGNTEENTYWDLIGKTCGVFVALENPIERKKMVEKLPEDTEYFTYIHPTAVIDLKTVEIGKGTIICPYCVLTTNIKIGNHCHFNLLSTVGHDSFISDFVTTAPGSKISGNCGIGKYVYFGTNSSVKEKIKICDNVIIGAGACVVKDINNSGTYVGVPSKLKNT